ncbi:lymphocyte activation gene 3 protein [Erythrolamprus reginae]|uniref:lymphocyte activation gene 3 protein n=1 Tax=Erythrolamprus reginae TaxID=121349 RepID=UPI00396C4E56
MRECLLWGHRVVVTPRLRDTILTCLHTADPNIVRMKSLGCSYIGWPKMDQGLEDSVTRNNECQQYRPAPLAAPIQEWNSPRSPWSRLHLDLAGPFHGQTFLVLVDAHSKWVELGIMQSTSSEPIITRLEQLPMDCQKYTVTHLTGEKVWGVEGTPVTLPCYLSPRMVKDNVRHLYKGIEIYWGRHGGSSSMKPHMVLKVEPSGLKSLAHSMMRRVTIWDTGFLQGNFSLQIKPLLKKDAGTYDARVRYGNKDWHCLVELGVVSVTAHPSRPLIESESVRLNCNSSHPGNPTNILWFHRDVLVRASHRLHPMGQNLLITESVSSDTGQWVCQLTFTDGERIVVRYNLQVIGFSEQASSVIYAAAGSDAYLPCVLNSNPMNYGISGVAIQWRYMAGRELRAKPTPSYENHQDFTLHLPAVGVNNAGQYLCEITIQGITIIQNVTLAVMAVITSTVGPRIPEGSHMVLICNLSYYTGKEHFQWKRLDLESSNSSQTGSSRPVKWGPVQEFPQISSMDAGTWECSAHGPEGKLVSAQYHLEIAASAQLANLPSVSTETIFGLLLLFFLVVLLFIIASVYLRRRMYSLNFQALDRIVALSGKVEKNGSQKKILQSEC